MPIHQPVLGPNGYLSGLGNNPLAPIWGQNSMGQMQQPMQAPQPDLASKALPVYSRPAPEMSQMPQPGWQGPQGGLGLADILDGPQFGQGQSASPAQSAPPVAGPSPKPQQNFDALGQNLMSQILGK